MGKLKLNSAVTKFLDELQHPLRDQIEQLRKSILSANSGLTENIKWNGPNYSFHGEDRITMRIHPPKQIQLIFHCGAKVQEQPKNKLITDDSGLLTWKANDRCFVTFKSLADILSRESDLNKIINDWLKTTKT
jgi:hypothetical protein